MSNKNVLMTRCYSVNGRELSNKFHSYEYFIIETKIIFGSNCNSTNKNFYDILEFAKNIGLDSC